MRVLRATDYRRMPWKNGAGETIEMLVSPPGASFDSFDWRLSMAHVGAPGPFSLFPDVDRTLSVIAGAGLVLRLADQAPVTLDRHATPFAFPGDIAVDSTLVDGPVDDLNVMTRRVRFNHRVVRHTLAAPAQLAWSGDIAILVAISDATAIEIGGQNITLEPQDAIVLETGDAMAFTASPQSETDLFVIEIRFG
jgi:environmental stress-induced protein Ves